GGMHLELTYDSQLRWLGPEKGVMTMAIGAVVNALWDLRARREGRPLWLTLASLTPEELLDLVDLRYLEDALSPRRRWRSCAVAPRASSSASPRCARRACPATRRLPAGSATATRSSSGCCTRRARTASRWSSSRSVPTPPTTSAGCGSPAR